VLGQQTTNVLSVLLHWHEPPVQQAALAGGLKVTGSVTVVDRFE
jgi:hypothetical protein